MRANLYRRALFLSYVTVGYNVLEAVVSLFFGAQADSPALVGFGLDSVIESLSGGIMIWRFTSRSVDDSAAHEKRELRAITLVGSSFFLLGGLTLYNSASSLIIAQYPSESLVGIIVAVASLIVMPVLFFLKRSVGRKLESHSLQADARQTLACWALSLALLIGLAAHSLFGAWWADPLAGLIIGLYLIWEGFMTLKRRQLCAC